jgi:hypothetical protein
MHPTLKIEGASHSAQDMIVVHVTTHVRIEIQLHENGSENGGIKK